MKREDVTPCPPECAFDWTDFLTKLDIAAAHLIDESPGIPGVQLVIPSKISLMDFLEYSFHKRELQNEQKNKNTPKDEVN